MLRFAREERSAMSPAESDVPYGTLDLMVLSTLAVLGPLHGYGIARRIEQVAEGRLTLNQGTIYPALLRLEQKGWIKGTWGTSEHNRRARFYAVTKAGRKQLATEADRWEQTVAMLGRLLGQQS
jgi:PadR family transcriptional regulator